MAKKDAAEMRGVLKRLQDKSWAVEINRVQESLSQIRSEINEKSAKCRNASQAFQQNPPAARSSSSSNSDSSAKDYALGGVLHSRVRNCLERRAVIAAVRNCRQRRLKFQTRSSDMIRILQLL